MLGGLNFEHLHEVAVDGATVVGATKRWHLFHFVARKC